MAKGRPGGNPAFGKSIAQKSIAPGEETTTISLRLARTQLDLLEALPGKKADHVRAALKKYLDELETPCD